MPLHLWLRDLDKSWDESPPNVIPSYGRLQSQQYRSNPQPRVRGLEHPAAQVSWHPGVAVEARTTRLALGPVLMFGSSTYQEG